MEIQGTHLLEQTSRLRSTGHVEGIDEEIKYNGVVSTPVGKRKCERPKRRRKLNVALKAAK